MKKLIFFTLLITGALSLQAQANKADLLQDLEKNQPANQNITATATLKSSTRLFGDKNDLTTVIMIIPSGSTVNVLGSDSAYLHVTFEENEGYIFKRHAVLDKTPVNNQQVVQQQPATQEEQPQVQQVSRFSYLENKYGSNMAARLNSGKIWKGMNSEMVKDSWGTAEKINRVISGNLIKEEWIYKSTWLYFENNALVEWGPIR
ncbi:MAG: hypothetical protein EPN88_05355 [Bacteroidetes bacterium]|nr:MAG: hypothetical protein EPN88_05355 [Bacteroidota bacterium]